MVWEDFNGLLLSDSLDSAFEIVEYDIIVLIFKFICK